MGDLRGKGSLHWNLADLIPENIKKVEKDKHKGKGEDIIVHQHHQIFRIQGIVVVSNEDVMRNLLIKDSK